MLVKWVVDFTPIKGILVKGTKTVAEIKPKKFILFLISIDTCLGLSKKGGPEGK